MGVPRFKPPPRINYQTRSERISASSLSNARDRFCVVSLSPCDFFPEFLQVRYTGVNRERWWLRAMELFRSMGHSSMSIPRSRWNDRKFMEGERTRGWTKRETVYEFMTAARGLVRFISQYKFFFLSLSFYFFFFLFARRAEEPHSFDAITKPIDAWCLYDRCAIFAAPPREGGKEETRKGGRRTSSEKELRWLPGGRWVLPSFFLPTPWLAVFPSFPSRLVHTSRCVPAFIIITVIIISSERGRWIDARGKEKKGKGRFGEKNEDWRKKDVKGEREEEEARDLLKEAKKEKKDEEEKNEERRRRGRKERLGTKKELGNGEETLSVGSWLAPPLVICSSDIIAACYSEAHQRTYRADYLSTDSTSLLPLSPSFSPSPLAPSPFPSRLLPKNTSFFVTLGTMVQQWRNTLSSFESSVSVVIDAWRETFLGTRMLLNHRPGSFERGEDFRIARSKRFDYERGDNEKLRDSRRDRWKFLSQFL